MAAAEDHGKLIVGYVDLVCLTDKSLYVVDFKTDLPLVLGEELPKSYAKQVASYATLLGAQWIRGERILRSGLLYTASGDIAWLESSTDASGTQ